MPSATSPTTRATPTPGPPTSTTAPAPADTTTPTPPASWHAPGSTSSGTAGRPTPPTNPPATEPCKPCSTNNHKPPLDTGLLRGGQTVGSLRAESGVAGGGVCGFGGRGPQKALG